MNLPDLWYISGLCLKLRLAAHTTASCWDCSSTTALYQSRTEKTCKCLPHKCLNTMISTHTGQLTMHSLVQVHLNKVECCGKVHLFQ